MFCSDTIISGGRDTPTAENKMNPNIKGITQKEVWVGEVPAKYSLTNICMLKQGNYERGSEWEEEVVRERETDKKRARGRQNRRECSDSATVVGSVLKQKLWLWPFWKDSKACRAGLLW